MCSRWDICRVSRKPTGRPWTDSGPDTACSLAPDGLTNVWLIAPPAGAPQFYFMPKFDWSADEHYHVDLASEAFETFSIGPAKADV